MKIDKLKRRKSYRLRYYDYSSDGFYFVTICVKDHVVIFGEISDGQIQLTEIGTIVEEEWTKTPQIRKNVKLDEFIIMPNHIHGVIQLSNNLHNEPEPGRGVLQYAPTSEIDSKFDSPKNNLGSIIRGFKSSTTKRIRTEAFQEFKWQRNYYDRIVRNEEELETIRNYIRMNPSNWNSDKYHPRNL